MALSAILGGGFSRLGYGRRIAAVGGVAAVVRILGFVRPGRLRGQRLAERPAVRRPARRHGARPAQRLPPAGQPVHRLRRRPAAASRPAGAHDAARPHRALCAGPHPGGRRRGAGGDLRGDPAGRSSSTCRAPSACAPTSAPADIFGLTLLKSPVGDPAAAAVRLPVRRHRRLRRPEPPQRAGGHARRRRVGLALHPARRPAPRLRPGRPGRDRRSTRSPRRSTPRSRPSAARSCRTTWATLPKDIWLRQGDERHPDGDPRQGPRHRRRATVRLRGVSLFIYQKNTTGGSRSSSAGSRPPRRGCMPGFWQLKRRARGHGRARARSAPTACRSARPSTPRRPWSASPRPRPSPSGGCPRAIRLTEQAGLLRRRLPAALPAAPGHAAAVRRHVDPGRRLLAAAGAAGRPGGPGRRRAWPSASSSSSSTSSPARWAEADIIPLFAAAWAPAVVALLSGLTLLCYTEDG